MRVEGRIVFVAAIRVGDRRHLIRSPSAQPHVGIGRFGFGQANSREEERSDTG
jgi:hypothetical protein